MSSAPEIQSLFARIAPVYDEFNFWLSLGQHRIWKEMTVRWSGATHGDTALDVCCGSGDLSQSLGKRVLGSSQGRVIGLDFCPELLAIAEERVRDHPALSRIEWLEGDALALPFPADTFDCATMGYGLRNVLAIPQALQELRRVLKEGGKVAILDFNRPSPGWIAEFQRWYLAQIVVPLAQAFQVSADYAYIQPSLDRFPLGSEQVKLAYQAGFSQAVHYEIAGGLMGVLVAQK
ncbi:MAG: bifunctional demethylmenaquinone methyltransferase/2-methoxy-6-polyprenyl-1,4-benzoquinol methylase UbiE [Cyanobacteriota bacterium]|nr:bifunctional demethylmenaquinone methyltransferase/2-methoxy-6-polyprenyl-1,4-benzoquinol methylase UbiE [Cyanobacteriota bacterium]